MYIFYFSDFSWDGAFVIQLCSLYELRPPISRTKMAEVTELAIKSVKFYKHVVQSVEKFIQKVTHIPIEVSLIC